MFKVADPFAKENSSQNLVNHPENAPFKSRHLLEQLASAVFGFARLAELTEVVGVPMSHPMGLTTTTRAM